MYPSVSNSSIGVKGSSKPPKIGDDRLLFIAARSFEVFDLSKDFAGVFSFVLTSSHGALLAFFVVKIFFGISYDLMSAATAVKMRR